MRPAHSLVKKLTKLTVPGVALALLAACGQEPVIEEQASAEVGLQAYAGQGRDRLCLRQEQDGQAGFTTYAAQGDANCLLRGRFDQQGSAIVANGDPSCRVPVTINGNQVRLGAASPACAYYCGPQASFADKNFTAGQPGESATDIAGDPLC